MAGVSTLEPAIPGHLRTERTIPTKTPPDFNPPFPAYSARFPVKTKELVTAIVGVQHASSTDGQSAEFKQLAAFMDKDIESKPHYWEAAAVTDNRGYYNEAVIPYWPSKHDYYVWVSISGFVSWWDSLSPEGNTGWFLEVFFPSIDRLETVFSDNIPQA